MEQLLITDAILTCPLTASEQTLLAYLCQRAAANGGHCTDSNAELALALGIHKRSISRLINQLGERQLLQVSIAKDLANQRTLTPLDTLLADYRHLSIVKPSEHPLTIDKPADYRHFDYRQAGSATS
ncbi:MAG: helix-turn-helix domain-containing protein, partial [Stigonema ocellatum SAG 48.90 = DSM 106950]|nr:helix-turn-helix domain-containing protein [Stigonema ocellatum SAG 48.90 = DSM 106950]